jgi:single-strand DNA-binding protein
VRKGSQIYIEGRIRSREWERDGQRHFGIEIVVDEMKLLGRRQEGAPQGSYQQPAQPAYQQPAQPAYQQPAQPAYQQPAPAPMPAAPAMPADDPDDLPF